MLLNKLFKNAPEIDIKQLSADSRVPMKDAIFFCVQGFKYDGHEYIEEAIKNGAVVIVYEKPLQNKLNAIYIRVQNVDDCIKKIAPRFYGHPEKDLESYLVCGCYGRSSVTSFINYFLNKSKSCGYIGRFGIKYADTELYSAYPTLTSLENIKHINNMNQYGVKAITLEASASSLSYNKLNIINPSVFIYTNTYKECPDYKEYNLDYFDDIRHYLYSLEERSVIILNKDDISYNELKDVDHKIVTYGTNKDSKFRIRNIFLGKNSSKFDIETDDYTITIPTNLLGVSSVYNLTAAIVSLIEKGYNPLDLANSFVKVPYIDGVMESIDDDYHIIVDCADSIESINELLQFARFVSKNNKVIGVLGISATDDKNRLKNMIEAAEKYLDIIYLTEENTYESDINKLLSKAAIYQKENKTIKVESRNIAIESAIEVLNKEDMLVLIGMGNDKIMIKGLGKQTYFGDKEYAKYYLNKRRKEENEVI